MTRERRNEVQNAWSSLGPAAIPRTWRHPSVPTPTATTVAIGMTRPPSLTLWNCGVRAHVGTLYLDGPVQECLDIPVELLSGPGDLAPRDPVYAQAPDQVVDLPC